MTSGDAGCIRICPASNPTARRASSGRIQSSAYAAPVKEALANIGVGAGLVMPVLTATASPHRPSPFPGPLHARSTDLRKARGLHTTFLDSHALEWSVPEP